MRNCWTTHYILEWLTHGWKGNIPVPQPLPRKLESNVDFVFSEEYYEIIDEFLRAVTFRWPNVLIQFEDFSNEHALSILEKYRYKYLCFNDDIQGTGSVTLAGVINAIRQRGDPKEALANERIVVVGAGSAGLGVTNSYAILHLFN